MARWLLTGKTENSTERKIVTAEIPNSSVRYGVAVTDQEKAPVCYTVGPGGGGGVNIPRINPHDSNNMFLVCDMSSEFYTVDGKTWLNPKLYGLIPRFFFHPYDENVVYAANHNLIFKSVDKGRNWNYFFPPEADIAGVVDDGYNFRPVIKRARITAGEAAGSEIVTVYVDPSNVDHIYALARGTGTGNGFGNGGFGDGQGLSSGNYGMPQIFRTTDGGATWHLFYNASRATNKLGAALSGGPDEDSFRYTHADMIIFKGQLHVLSTRGYAVFSLEDGLSFEDRVVDHNFFSNYCGQFVVSDDGETLNAYCVMLRNDANISDSTPSTVKEHTINNFFGYARPGGLLEQGRLFQADGVTVYEDEDDREPKWMRFENASNVEVAATYVGDHYKFSRHVFKIENCGEKFRCLTGHRGYRTDVVGNEPAGKVSLNFISDLRYTQHGVTYPYAKRISRDAIENSRHIEFRCFAVSGNTLYVGYTGAGNSHGGIAGIAKTTDDGETWEGVMSGSGTNLSSQILLNDRGERVEGFPPEHLENLQNLQCPGTLGGMLSPQSTIAGNMGRTTRDIAVSSTDPNHVMFTTSYTLYCSRDGGLTWSDMASHRTDGDRYAIDTSGLNARFRTTGIEPACPQSMAVDPHDKNHHIVSWIDIGLFETWDNGRSWRNVNGSTGHPNYDIDPDTGLPTDKVSDTYRPMEPFNRYGGGQSFAVAFDPFKAGQILADHALEYSGEIRDRYGVTPLGMRRDGSDWWDISRNPNDSGVWTKGSSRWSWVNNYQGNSYRSGSSNHLRPNNRMTKLFRSVDHGKTWNDVGLDVICGTDGIVFDPHHAGVVYASFLGAGIHKSTDYGITWTPWNAGIAVQTFTFMSQSSSVYLPFVGISAVILKLSGDRKSLLVSLGNSDEEAGKYVDPLYELDIYNGATEWAAIPRPQPDRVNTLRNTPLLWDENAPDSKNEFPVAIRSIAKSVDGTYYASTHRLQEESNDRFQEFNGADIRKADYGGAYVREDNGEWRQIFDPRISVAFIHPDSRHQDVLYLYASRRIWRSDKGKDTVFADWRPLDVNFKNDTGSKICKLWEDPLDPNRIYVATDGNGMWSIHVSVD